MILGTVFGVCPLSIQSSLNAVATSLVASFTDDRGLVSAWHRVAMHTIKCVPVGKRRPFLCAAALCVVPKMPIVVMI